MAFIIKSNASLGSDFLIKDLGFLIPNSGGSVTLTEYEEIQAAQESEDLKAALIDDAFGAGSSTLIMNDGTSDIAQADAANFVDTYNLPDGSENFGVVTTNAAGEITEDLTTNASTPGQLNNWQLGTDLDANNFNITGLPANPSGPTAAASQAYVDAVAAQGKSWKERVLTKEQFVDGGAGVGGIQSGIAFFLDGQPSATNTFIIQRSTPTAVTETFTFVASESVAFDVGIGASTDDTLDNLAQAINDDSTIWAAQVETSLNSINDGSGSSTAGRVLVIREATPSESSDGRIYGVLATQADGQYVNYNGETDYALATNSTLSTTDPAQKEFGFGREFSSLITNETHACLDNDAVKTWDADAQQWQDTGANGLTFSNGLTEAAGNVTPDYGEVGDVQAVGTANAAGTLDEIARADHVHAHGDQSGTSSTFHDGASITAPAGLTNIGSPADVDAALSNIDAALGDGKFGKLLNFGASRRVPSSGTRYLASAGGVVGSTDAGLRMMRAGTITGLSLQPEVADSSRAFKLSVEKSTDNGASWSEAALLTMGTTVRGVNTVTPTAGVAGLTYAAGDLLRALVVRTSGSGFSTSGDWAAQVEVNEA